MDVLGVYYVLSIFPAALGIIMLITYLDSLSTISELDKPKNKVFSNNKDTTWNIDNFITD
jgi:hypothetical protein